MRRVVKWANHTGQNGGSLTVIVATAGSTAAEGADPVPEVNGEVPEVNDILLEVEAVLLDVSR
jgi:hypothetical protein